MRLIKLALVILLVKSSLINSDRCGVQKIKTRDLIVQGYDTYPGQFPWHVAIFHRRNRHTIEYACGGSLISRNFVLTAAHCTKSKDGYEFSAKRLSVYVGIHDKHELGSNLAQHSVYEIHRVSPEDQWVNLRNDIALLELNGNVRFTNYVQPICLNSLNLSYEAVGTVPGWGRTEEHETSDILKIASLPIVTTIDCLASDRGAFGEMLDNGIICAGYRNGTRVCTGDSGGGLVVKQCSILGCSWTVLGIVSFASSDEKGSCRSDGYGLFTKVQTYLPWIKQVTEQQFEDSNPDNLCGQRWNESLRTRWPWHGTIYRTDSKPFLDGIPVSEAFGVTILNDQFVITTGIVHQLVELDRAVHRIRFGRVIDGESDNYTQTMSIEEFFVSTDKIHQKDDYQTLVLFKLSGYLQFTKFVQPICLWKGDSILDSQVFTVSFDTSNPNGRTFGEISMSIASLLDCVEENKRSNSSRYAHIFCGKNDDVFEVGPRFWDIGTGLVMNKDNRWYLQGLFSMVMGAQAPLLNKDYAMFLNVSHSYDWIVSTIETNSNLK